MAQSRVQEPLDELILGKLSKNPDLELKDIAQQIGIAKRTIQDKLKNIYHTTFSELQAHISASRVQKSAPTPITMPIIPSAANDDPPPEDRRSYQDITEDVWKDCLLELINTTESMTTGIIDKIRDYLDKKQAITIKDVPKPQPNVEDSCALVR